MRLLLFALFLAPALAFAQGVPLNCADTAGQHLNYETATHKWVCGTSSAGGGSWLLKSAAGYTAVSGDKIVADSSGGGFTITLPAAPATGASVEFKSGGSAAANNVTVARNGSTIMGAASNLLLDTDNVDVILVFDGTTWRL